MPDLSTAVSVSHPLHTLWLGVIWPQLAHDCAWVSVLAFLLCTGKVSVSDCVTFLCVFSVPPFKADSKYDISIWFFKDSAE